MISLLYYISKGGVGKTTLSGLTGQFLAGLGYNGVIIDLDRQGSQTMLFNLNTPEMLGAVVKRERSITSSLVRIDESMVPRFKKRDAPGALALLPGGRQSQLAISEVVLFPDRFGLESNAELFVSLLDELAETADFAIIDMGPSDPIVAIGALLAVDYLVIPTDSEWLSLQQIGHVLSEVAVAREVNPALEILGIVPTKMEYHFGRLRQSKTQVATWAFLESNYPGLLLRDSGGAIDLPYDEDWKTSIWIGEMLFSETIGRRAKSDAMRYLNALGAKLGLEAVMYE